MFEAVLSKPIDDFVHAFDHPLHPAIEPPLLFPLLILRSDQARQTLLKEKKRKKSHRYSRVFDL